jgi:transcriptional regulator with XRE-family HTH domain
MILDMQDLKTVRESKGLTQQDVTSMTGLPQGHIARIESGSLLPRRRTRVRLEQILGSEIDWVSTLSRDRGHIGYALNELLNLKEPGVDERIRFCKQYLTALERLTDQTLQL